MTKFIWKFLSLTCICAVFMVIGTTDTFAYLTYNGGGINCVQCHPGFLGGLAAPLHDAHLNLSSDCMSCHVIIGDDPLTGLTPTSDTGTGCVGCHGRLEDAGNDGANAGLGAGLRQVHEAGGASCTPCHTDTIASYTPVLEAVRPPFYTALAVDPCADNLDNDGDGSDDVCDDSIAFGTLSGDVQAGITVKIYHLTCVWYTTPNKIP